MKKVIYALLVLPLLFANCSDDDDNNDETPVEVSTTYTLEEVGESGVSGTAKFIKVDETTTTIEVVLEGTPAEGDHPMHIHFEDAATGGGVALGLQNVDGSTGLSTTTVTQLADETAINYEGLISFDGHINVHLSADDLATIVAQGDIGSNVQ